MPFPVVGVGASAGGLEAFIELLQQFPERTGMAFVVIQHLDPTHPSYLGEALAKATHLPVEQIRDGIRIEPDHVYVIPPNADVGMLDGSLFLLPRPKEGRKPHLPIDFFFKALAVERKHQAIGIVLSGTGSDGAEGLRSIKSEGGLALVQDPRSAKFGGMPEAAIGTGVVDLELPIPALAEAVLRLGHHPLLRDGAIDALKGPSDDQELRKIFVVLRNTCGIDFSEYKPTSIRRRLARRLALHRLRTLEEYVSLLREDPMEAKLLCEDVLVHVTSFFRDPEALAQLKVLVFPALLKQKRERFGPIRIWTAGCSTGEEAYSVLICLLEFLDQEGASDIPVQMFATDVSDRTIEKARAGVYPDGATREVSAERLARYFTQLEGGGYRINKFVRERCAFARHDLASDPPFSKLDLITCRNVLIYFGADLQKRILSTFHFSLNVSGFLVLGHAETVADGPNYWSVVDSHNKIFARTATKSTLHLAPPRAAFPAAASTNAGASPGAKVTELVRRAENALLERYSPPGVIVNERMEILHFQGRTASYLEPAPGHPQHDLLKMARGGLVADLRIAISRAAREQVTVRRSRVCIEQDGSGPFCDVLVIPIKVAPDSQGNVFLVLFEELRSPEASAPHESGFESAAGSSAPDMRSDALRAARAEEELKATAEHLQAIIVDHQRTNAELMAANEELLSANEELQSLNEELETAKEELQSTNEELSTLNEELQSRNEQLDSVNSDLINILGSVEIPLVIVDARRRIRRFTPKARPILNLLPSDVGRPIDDIRPNLTIERLDAKIAEVVDTLVIYEEEVEGHDQRWYRLQIRPYLTVDKKINGAVISVVDINVLKRALGAAEWARDYARAAVEAVQMPLLILNENLDVLSCNQVFHETYGLRRDECHGRSLYTILDRAWDIPALRSALARVLEDDREFQKLEAAVELAGLGCRWMLLSGRPVRIPGGERMILLAVEDTTERRRGEAQRARLLEDATAATESAERANRAKDSFLATLSHELRTPLSSLLMQAQLLRMGHMDEARIQRAGESIERAAKAQSQLIDDLLDISRIVAGKLKMEQQIVGLAPIVQAAVDTLLPVAERKGVELVTELAASLPPVSGDAARLQQAVSNLLTNAIKFTPARGRVTVTLDRTDGLARIRVADTGIGIDPAFQPYVFDRFMQEDHGQTRAHGGLGLGLAIVRYLIESHGGSVQAASAGRNCGSTFTILLRLLDGERHAVNGQLGEAAAGEPRAGSIRGVRVLVVEDDQGTREALLEMLRLSGAEPHAVGSAAEAMQTFQRFRPQVLVCDIAMPQEDGYSLLRRVRALGPGQGGDVPALALTALASAEDRRQAFAAGFQTHLAKPVDIDRFATAVAHLLSHDASRSPAR